MPSSSALQYIYDKQDKSIYIKNNMYIIDMVCINIFYWL